MFDRIVEVDVDALGDGFDPSRIDAVISRLSPAWHGVPATATRGLVLNLGWLMDPVLLWTGKPAQALPIRSSRLAPWSRVTYQQLQDLVTDVRSAARRNGVPDLRVGILVLGIGEFVNEIVRLPQPGEATTEESALYRERSDWFAGQPQLYPFGTTVTLHGPGLDWRSPLRADNRPLATRPEGIAEGDSFADLLADQWASFSTFAGMDLLLLRDETTTPVHAGRVGFDGSHARCTAEEVDEWTDSLVAAVTAIKRASPTTWLMLYSSGLSPTVEAVYGRLDIVRVVAESDVDAWVDQTWGGAWQDWWDAGWQGWTFQLSNLLARAALIAEGNLQRRGSPCRHYALIQLLDGWEPYDTLHDYPAKLHWGIWAFTHATVAQGPHLLSIGGHYLAVANDRTGELIAERELGEVLDVLQEASESAAQRTEVLGPVLVADDAPTAVDRSPSSEPPEDGAGFLLKWGLPCLTATTDRLGAHTTDWRITGPQASLGSKDLVIGSSDDLNQATTDALCVTRTSERSPSGYRRGTAITDEDGLRTHSWPYLQSRFQIATERSELVIYDSEDGPLSSKATNGGIWWMPPAIANGLDRRLTHYQIGSADPHFAVACSFARNRVDGGLFGVAPRSIHETITAHGWVSGQVVHVLLGNVESGWLGDSRFERETEVVLPERFTRGMTAPELRDGHGSAPVRKCRATVTVPPEGYRLLRLIDTHESR